MVYMWIIASTMFFGTMAIVVSFASRSGNEPHKVARIWARWILRVSGIKVGVRGAANMDPDASCIFMCNHQSNFDIPALLAHLDSQFRWIAKAELFKIPIFGQAMARAGYISIDRSDRKSAFESLNRAARIIRNGVSVMIFPEGTRSHTGAILPFKKGGFILAVDSGVPLIPLIIHGTRAIMPKSTLRIRPGSVQIEIRPPIDASAYARKTKDALLERVRREITTSFERGAERVR